MMHSAAMPSETAIPSLQSNRNRTTTKQPGADAERHQHESGELRVNAVGDSAPWIRVVGNAVVSRRSEKEHRCRRDSDKRNDEHRFAEAVNLVEAAGEGDGQEEAEENLTT